MESTYKRPATKGVSVLGALAGMLITFIGGVYVGLHPSWIPIKGVGPSAGDTGPMKATPSTGPAQGEVRPTTMPSTMPSTIP
jgi:hypothetical protein